MCLVCLFFCLADLSCALAQTASLSPLLNILANGPTSTSTSHPVSFVSLCDIIGKRYFKSILFLFSLKYFLLKQQVLLGNSCLGSSSRGAGALFSVLVLVRIVGF
jgi:hypothetical protein